MNSEKIPFEAFKYLISEINYGGQVIDVNDMRLLKSLLDNYMSPNILLENHKFIKNCYAKDLKNFEI